jgi:hypothetical protein
LSDNVHPKTQVAASVFATSTLTTELKLGQLRVTYTMR